MYTHTHILAIISNYPLHGQLGTIHEEQVPHSSLFLGTIMSNFIRMRFFFCFDLFQMQLKNRWGRKMHMASIRTTLSVLKALDARKTDKRKNTFGQQWLSGKECRQASKCRQGWGTEKKKQCFLGLTQHPDPELWEMALSAGRSVLVMLPKQWQLGLCARDMPATLLRSSSGLNLPDLRKFERWWTGVSSCSCESSLRSTPKHSVIRALLRLMSTGFLSL